MESIGERLKKVREEKGYSIEQVSRETNIARKYLRALEEEDFSAFPGDTYLVGFLHNYAEYLGLDSNEMVTLYKNIKLQEQPAPIEELLETPRKRISPVLVLFLLFVVVAGGGSFYKFFYLPRRTEKPPVAVTIKKSPSAPVPSGQSASYEVNDSVIERYFKEGSTMLVPVGDRKVLVRLVSVKDTVVLSYPHGTVDLKLGITKTVDLNNDGKGDINITVNDIDTKAHGAVIRFDRFINTKKTGSGGAALSSGAAEQIGLPNSSSQKKAVKVILSENKVAPFVLKILFRGYCFVRYAADNGERVEQYFNKGETLHIDVDREVRLWISNAGALSARLSGKDVVFGKPGEVAAALIAWKKDSQNGQFDLQLIPVY